MADSDFAAPRGPARAVRIDLAAPAELTDSDGGRVAVVVRDLSKDGCRLSTDGSLIAGEAVSLRVGREAPLAGVVAWVQGDEAGVRFATPPRLD
ncbi:PilZ domain-containing protein [Sphingomicrobium astaxanthinifaciens]|uniref:PilZ domain-containing protein n=1 Tax=Sphingomicrobium astaxanthinifaciens TaxID=1227949 RepID=UPI001FCA5FF0|nr:PilZ domain-containing protein [Sphingomicrobium astaxanthinifaciens]MCJ7420571.1 PilZ domain-containing protein [Sphingomicrobium astaxanthinifaciens]